MPKAASTEGPRRIVSFLGRQARYCATAAHLAFLRRGPRHIAFTQVPTYCLSDGISGDEHPLTGYRSSLLPNTPVSVNHQI